MSINTRIFRFVLFTAFGIIIFSISTDLQGQSVMLYTPYTKIAVPPGKTINYTIDVINKSSNRQNIDISVASMPKEWNYNMKSGGWDIKRLSVLPGEKKSIILKVDVPYKVKKGTYMFKVVAHGFYSLPLVVVVSKQGNYKTEFTTKQSNMQGNANSSFTFSTQLKNITGEKQLYALKAFAPRGWNVVFKPNYKQATSVELEPNNSVNISINVKPPHQVKAGTYKIPVRAITVTTSADLTLEVVITGTYNMELTTPTGLLSTSITAGDEKRVKLLVNNTGSAKLQNIKFRSSTPADWDVIFDPKQVDELDPGEPAEVFATIKAYKKAIAGDYVTYMTASTPEVSSKISFRITVKTPMLMGWIGIIIIVVVLGSVYYLFRKFGRR